MRYGNKRISGGVIALVLVLVAAMALPMYVLVGLVDASGGESQILTIEERKAIKDKKGK